MPSADKGKPSESLGRKAKGPLGTSRGSQLPKLGGFFMSFSYSHVAAKVAAGTAVLMAIVTLASAAPASAQEVSIIDSIAQAKSKVWGEYPKAETAYPEFAVKYTAPVKEETSEEASAPKEKPVTTQVNQTLEPVQATEVKPAPAETAKVESATVAVPVTVETAPAPTVETTGDALIDEIVRLTNEARATEGLSPLKINLTLNQAAAIRAAELPSSPSPHLRPDGAAFYTVFKQVGLTPKKGGENYAVGTAGAFSADAIVTAWMNSPSHRKNIMNAGYTEIGIGYTTSGGNDYFEQLFIA